MKDFFFNYRQTSDSSKEFVSKGPKFKRSFLVFNKKSGNKFFLDSYGKENVHDCNIQGLGNLNRKSSKFNPTFFFGGGGRVF